MMSERLDGRLDEQQAARLDEHLETCEECQIEWENLQALDQLLRSVPMAEAPVRVRVQVMARLSRRDQARRAIAGGTTLTLGAVALVLLGLAPVLLGLLGTTGILPALANGGPVTAIQFFSFVESVGQALLVVVEALALPLLGLALAGLLLAVVLNGLWIGAARRVRGSR